LSPFNSPELLKYWSCFHYYVFRCCLHQLIHFICHPSNLFPKFNAYTLFCILGHC
jgi:hypothetical protein